LYIFAWTGWWYIFDFIIASMIGYIIYFMIMHRSELKKGVLKVILNKDIKNTFILLMVFFGVSGIFVAFFNNFEIFLSAFTEPIRRLSIGAASSADLWPNVLTTVAELNNASIAQIIGQIGGTLLFAISLIGIMLTMLTNKPRDKWVLAGSALWFVMIVAYQEKLSLYMFLLLLSLPIIIGLLVPLITKEHEIDVKYALFMTLWFMVTIFTATKGVRFILLLVPVFGVAFGIAVGKIYDIIVEWTSNELEMNKTVTKAITVMLLLFLLVAPVKAAHNNAMQQVPMMNDGWYQSLIKIKNESAPDAIVNSWWDFGHWFTAIADRAVTFDGGSQSTPMAHWIGKTLLTGDEDTSVGILRMLDCGSNTAFEELNKKLNDTHKSVSVLYEIIVLKKEDAIKKLSDYVDSKTADDIVSKYTHCNAPEDYFITSEDMVGKSGVWAHFGSWDFARAEVWRDNRELSFDDFVKKVQEQNYGIDEKTAKDMYYQIQTITDERAANSWIAPWPSYVSGKTACAETNDEIRCQNGLIINKTDFNAWIPTNDGVLHPKTFIYNDAKGELKIREYEKGKVITTGDGTYLGAGLIKNGNTYYSILMDDRLSQSLFTKLFYFEGEGTTHFEKFSDVRAVTGERIIVWKVNWEGK
jgi:dolichyl-diphosphooligosaccharide--protein glycosyltransferase